MKVFYCFFLLSAFTVSLSQTGVISFMKNWWNSGKNKEVDEVPDIHLKNVHVLPKLKVTGISQGNTTLAEIKVTITSTQSIPERTAVEVKENVESMEGKPEGEGNPTESEVEENVKSTTGKPEGESKPTESEVEENVKSTTGKPEGESNPTESEVEENVKSTTGKPEGESNSKEPEVEVNTASPEEKSTTGKPEGETNSMDSELEGEPTVEEEADSVKPDEGIASPKPEPSV